MDVETEPYGLAVDRTKEEGGGSWPLDAIEKSFAYCLKIKKETKERKQKNPNSVSKIVKLGPLVSVKYNGKNENEETSYYASFDENEYARIFRGKNALPIESVIKYTPSQIQSVMTGMVRYGENDFSGKAMDEKFYDYIINLGAIPMLVPVSPVVLMLTRPSLRNPYDSSTLSLCILKTLHRHFLDGFCDLKRVEKNGGDNGDLRRFDKPKRIIEFSSENLRRDENQALENYEETMFVACEAFKKRFVENVEWENFLIDKNRKVTKSDGDGNDDDDKEAGRLCDNLRRFLYRVQEIMHRYLVRLINIYEIACTALYVSDEKSKKEFEFWPLLTKDIFKPFPLYEIGDTIPATANMSKTSYELMVKSNSFDVETMGAFLVGKNANGDSAEMSGAQRGHVDYMVEEYALSKGYEPWEKGKAFWERTFACGTKTAFLLSEEEEEGKRKNETSNCKEFFTIPFSCLVRFLIARTAWYSRDLKKKEEEEKEEKEEKEDLK